MLDVIDCHGHIFPPLGGACGFASAELHLAFQQRAIHLHVNQPVRRARDHAVVVERHLWDTGDPSERGRARNVDFRVGRYGRFEWQKDGERYYVQFLPPSLQDMAAPPEFMITQMDYAGVQTVVLQNDHIYGNLADYFADAEARYPGRFIGLAQVEEAFAYRDDQMQALRDQIERRGMKGLYFTFVGFFRNGYAVYYSDPPYQRFWDLVADLGIPVFWVFINQSPRGDFAHELRAFRAWHERYPTIRSVLVHGLPTHVFADDRDVLRFPDYVVDLLEKLPVYSEVLYPIMWAGKMNFPFARAQSHFRQLYNRFGADRLIWGSDMPNVERFCTYRQTLAYLLDYSNFLTEADRAKIFRETTRSLFKA
jgi:predicted TIM-barrel fold metal-dependent hydrolase